MARKLAIFTCINLIIAIIAGLMPVSIISEKAFSRQAVVYDYINGIESGSKINVILGDSRPECCIAAEEFGFVNLSLAGTTPVEGYHMLALLLEKGVEIDKLMLSYGPNHLFGQEIFYSRSRYFSLIDEEFLDGISQQAIDLSDDQYLQYHWQALEVIDDYLSFIPEKMKFSLVNVLTLNETLKSILGYISDKTSPPDESIRLVADPRYKLYEATPEDFINREKESPEYFEQTAYSEINELHLSKILTLSKQNSIDIAYVFMPFNRDVLQPEEEYFEKVSALIGNNGLASCVVEIQWWPNSEFFDAAHLNPVGVSHFSEYLNKELQFCIN